MTLLGILPFIILRGMAGVAKSDSTAPSDASIIIRNMEDPTGTFHAYLISKDIRKERYSALVGLKQEWPIINEKVTAGSVKELEGKVDQAYTRLMKRWEEHNACQ